MYMGEDDKTMQCLGTTEAINEWPIVQATEQYLPQWNRCPKQKKADLQDALPEIC